MITKDYHQIIKEKEMKLKLGVLTFACSVGLLLMGSQAQAYNLTDYTLNFSGAAAADGDSSGITNIQNVNEMDFIGQSVVAFHDNDHNNVISQGDTFDDYFAIKFNDFVDTGLNPQQDTATYGTTHQLTVLGKASGKQIVSSDPTKGAYVINSLQSMNFYFDATTTGTTVGDDTLGAFTAGDYTNLATLADGVKVEDAGLVSGGGVNDDGTHITGSISLVLTLNDVLHGYDSGQYGFFETDANGNPLPINLTQGIVGSGNTQASIVDISAFASYFGFNYDAANKTSTDYDFLFSGTNHGGLTKQVVPEPATMTLFGLGIFGLAGLRKKISSKPSSDA
jgi:hypothetical protein